MPRKKNESSIATAGLDLGKLESLAQLLAGYSLKEVDEARALAFFHLSRGVPAMTCRIRELEGALEQALEEGKKPPVAAPAAPPAKPQAVKPEKGEKAAS